MERSNEKKRIAAENAKLAEIRRTETPEERLKRIGYKGFKKGGVVKKTRSTTKKKSIDGIAMRGKTRATRSR
jgi:hypothetical protein